MAIGEIDGPTGNRWSIVGRLSLPCERTVFCASAKAVAKSWPSLSLQDHLSHCNSEPAKEFGNAQPEFVAAEMGLLEARPRAKGTSRPRELEDTRAEQMALG